MWPTRTAAAAAARGNTHPLATRNSVTAAGEPDGDGNHALCPPAHPAAHKPRTTPTEAANAHKARLRRPPSPSQKRFSALRVTLFPLPPPPPPPTGGRNSHGATPPGSPGAGTPPAAASAPPARSWASRILDGSGSGGGGDDSSGGGGDDSRGGGSANSGGGSRNTRWKRPSSEAAGMSGRVVSRPVSRLRVGEAGARWVHTRLPPPPTTSHGRTRENIQPGRRVVSPSSGRKECSESSQKGGQPPPAPLLATPSHQCTTKKNKPGCNPETSPLPFPTTPSGQHTVPPWQGWRALAPPVRGWCSPDAQSRCGAQSPPPGHACRYPHRRHRHPQSSPPHRQWCPLTGDPQQCLRVLRPPPDGRVRCNSTVARSPPESPVQEWPLRVSTMTTAHK